MCGIAGIVSLRGNPLDKTVLQQMTEVISHRGPDGKGTLINPLASVGLGHRRLSVLDLSLRGSQPMQYGQYSITFNGEIYNYLELRDELKGHGFHFSSDTDTEVILAAYQHWGSACVTKFNGMWAFAIFDSEADIVFCSRDRFGIKPFFYYALENFLYFASEIKQFTVIKGWKAVINMNRAYDFLKENLINHTEETMFLDVYELRGGQNLLVNLKAGSFAIERYYDVEEFQEQGYDPAKENFEIEDFRDTLKKAVKISMRSDVKVGAALSGGIDSSIIAALTSGIVKEAGNSIDCVSACYTGYDVDESKYIDKIADDKTLTIHKVFPSFDDFLANMDKIVWHQDEPFSTLSIYAQYAVFKEAARQNLTVMLDGQGADEILAGYASFYKPHLAYLFEKSLIKPLKLIFDYFRLHKEHHTDLIWQHLFPKKTRSNIFTEKFIHSAQCVFIRPYENTIRECTNNMILGFGLHSLLRYEDRNSMAFSVESRVPYLDHRVVEKTLTLNNKYKIRHGVRKFILREAFKNILPRMIYKRYDKIGAATPQKSWTHEHYDDFSRLLSEAEVILDGHLIKRELFTSFKTANRALSKADIALAWRIILFSRWIKVFKVSLG